MIVGACLAAITALGSNANKTFSKIAGKTNVTASQAIILPTRCATNAPAPSGAFLL